MIYCAQCGQQLVDDARFCEACGAAYMQVDQVPMAAMNAEELEVRPASIQEKKIGSMTQAVQRLENSIKERRDVDRSLVNWWLCILVLGPITFGIYLIIRHFYIVNRIDRFIIRKRSYYEALIELTGKYAQEHGKADMVNTRLQELSRYVNYQFDYQVKTINAWISFFLVLITFGIFGWVILYKMNHKWNDLQTVEQEFDEKLSVIWMELGLVRYPISFKIDPSKKRNFFLYVILTFATLGIWGLVWDYKIHNDPDILYKEFHSVEDTILHTVRQVV